MAVLAGLVVRGLTLGLSGRGTSATVTFVVAVAATILASAPIVQLPFVVRRFDAAMRTALGDFLRTVPPDRRARMRTAPIVPIDFLRGIDVGDPRITRGILFARRKASG